MRNFDNCAQKIWEITRRTIYLIPGQFFISTTTKMWHYCTIHKLPYLQTPHYVCRKDKPSGCPKCSDGKPGKRKRIDDYAQSVWQRHQRPTSVIEGQVYKNAHAKLWHYCLIHQYVSSRASACYEPNRRILLWYLCRKSAKSIEQYSQLIKEKSSRAIYVVPGQEIINFQTKMWYYCTIHKHAYSAKPNNVYTGIRKSGCPKCRLRSKKLLN